MKLVRIYNSMKIAIVTLTLFTSVYLPVPVSAAGTAIVSVSAPTQPVSSGTQFTVSITVEPNNAIAGAQFNLSFNPALVTANSVSEGNLLKQGGASTYFTPGTINNTAGTVTGVAGAITTPGQTVSTSGTFAIITFTTGTTKGTSTLTLSNVILGDINGQSVSLNLVNGQVSTDNPPVLNAIGNKTVNEGALLTFTISATDADANTLTYSASNLPSGAAFNTSTRVFSWTPTSGQAGTYPNVHFQVSDGTLTDAEDITITVNASSNSPPVLSSIGNKSVTAGQQLQFTVSATDADANTLTYSASNLPSGAAFNTSTRVFSWTPTSGQAGTYPNVHFQVSDGTLTDAEDITITVNSATPPISGGGAPSNSPPVLDSIGNKSVTAGQLLQFTISATDPNGNTLTYSASNLPSGASFDAGTQTFSWTPTSGQVETYPNVHFQVSDGTLTDAEDITITVNNIDQLSVTTYAASGITTSGATLNGNLTNKGSASTITVSFEYGLTSNYGSTVAGAPAILTAPGTFAAGITGLNPNTLYHYRAMVVGDSTAYGSDQTFTTSNTPPVVTTDAASGITTSGATLNGNLTSKGSASTITVSFEYGLTSSYGSTVACAPATLTAPGTFTAGITGLNPNTLYHYRAKAVGDSTAYGSDQTFTTPISVVDTSKVETSPLLPIEIVLLSALPSYDNETHKIISAEVGFWISNPSLAAVGKPILRVGLDGKALEAITVIDVDQSAEESINIIRDYVPSQGWKTGTYIFYVELIGPDGMLYKTNEQMLYVKSETAAIINWSILIVIITITLLIGIILEFVLIHRKRHMYNM